MSEDGNRYKVLSIDHDDERRGEGKMSPRRTARGVDRRTGRSGH